MLFVQCNIVVAIIFVVGALTEILTDLHRRGKANHGNTDAVLY
jgi:hypothetical protein